MAIPKNVPVPGVPSRPPGNSQSPQGGGLPRIPRAANPNVGSGQESRPNTQQPRPNNQPTREKPAVGLNRPSVGLPSIDTSGLPSHTSEYSFGENPRQARIRQPQSGPVHNPYDEDDETFTPLSIDDQLEYESTEDIADREARERSEAREREIEKRQAREREERRIRDEEELAAARAREDEKSQAEAEQKSSKKKSKKNKKEEEPEVYIDEKNLKLNTFGGNKKLKVNDLDNRKNLRQRAKVVQYVALGLVAAIAIFAGKNAFFPAESLSPEDVQTIVAGTTGTTGFPLNSGEGFAKDFMKAYLTVNGDVTSKQALGYYYTGSLTSADSPNRSISQNFRQEIMFGPTVYSSQGLTDHSARYTVGALVNTVDSNGSPPADGSGSKWEFFNVNVYYDKVNGSFSITPDSPTVIPSVEVGDPSKVPAATPLGEDKVPADVATEIQSVVHGFIKGYAVTSPIDHSTIAQYIVSDADEPLKKGLNGSYVLAGSEKDAITYNAYLTADPNLIKVGVTVNWRDQLGSPESNTKLEYKSNYVMTLEKQTNGKYLVSKFAPKYYAADLEE